MQKETEEELNEVALEAIDRLEQREISLKPEEKEFLIEKYKPLPRDGCSLYGRKDFIFTEEEMLESD